MHYVWLISKHAETYKQDTLNRMHEVKCMLKKDSLRRQDLKPFTIPSLPSTVVRTKSAQLYRQ